MALYHGLGCDVALFHWPPLAVWLPLLATRNAMALLQGLAAHLAEQEQQQLEGNSPMKQHQRRQHQQEQERPPSGAWHEAAGQHGAGQQPARVVAGAGAGEAAASTGAGASSSGGGGGCPGTESGLLDLKRGAAGGAGSTAGGSAAHGGCSPGAMPPHPCPTQIRIRRPHVVLVSYSGAAKGLLAPALERLVAAAAVADGTRGGGAVSVGMEWPGAGVIGSSGDTGCIGGSSTGGSGSGSAESAKRRRQLPPPPGGPVGDAERVVLRHLAGVVFDSGPVDFDSSVGVTLFANSKVPAVRQLQRAAGGAAAGAMDFFMYEVGTAAVHCRALPYIAF